MALMLSGDLDAGQLVSLRPFCGLNELIARPSGVCFDDQGNLYVTCMTSRVRLGNPSLSRLGGQLLCVILLHYRLSPVQIKISCLGQAEAAQILQYWGPLSSKPGQFMRVAAQWTEPGEARGEGDNKPWDVRWHRGIASIGAKHEPLLIVSRHAGIWQRCGCSSS